MKYRYHQHFGKRPTVAKGLYPAMDKLFQGIRDGMLERDLTLDDIEQLNLAFRVIKRDGFYDKADQTELIIGLTDFKQPVYSPYTVSLFVREAFNGMPAKVAVYYDMSETELSGDMADSAYLAVHYFANKAETLGIDPHLFTMPLRMEKASGTFASYAGALISFVKHIDYTLAKSSKQKTPDLIQAIRRSHLFDGEDLIHNGERTIYQFSKHFTTLQVFYDNDNALINVRLINNNLLSIDSQNIYEQVSELLTNYAESCVKK